MSLAELAPTYLAALESELRQAIGSEAQHRQPHRGAEAPAPASAYLDEYYAMLAYHLGWTDGGKGGKRIRPLLCLLTCTAAGGDWRQALPIAAAVELIHNFSLLHDDIQDNSPLRHGRPTVWTRWGAAQAINAGDAMFTLAYLAPHRLRAAGVSAEVALDCLADLTQTCLFLTQGQYLDMAYEQRAQISVAEYLTMIEKKTAVLIAAAARLGARVAGAAPARLEAFYHFGWNLGMAFQLQDDLLGIWGDPAVTGKSAASDLEKRKKSLPVVFGLERSPGFAAAYAAPHPAGAPVAALAAELAALGAREEVERRAQATTTAAMEALEVCDAAEPAARALSDLASQLLRRNQ
ncbi:MAG: polyprenyl synthetase family protein [Anaerolineales bacterium]|nr:polyprenyl synthetase family protein [Anaerolineales bacterium]